MGVKVWRKIAIDIVRDFDHNVMPLFGSSKGAETVSISPSGDETKIVDKVAENLVISKFKALGVNIVSEEIGVIDQGSDYTVLIDPLDGSYNFISGIPFFAVSVAVFKGNEPIYAFIYEPVLERFYEGIPGQGAYLNGEKLKVRKPDDSPSISFYTTGRGIGILNKVKRTRTLGAIALELAYLSRGALDGVVDIRNYLRPTDIAAGIIIAKEAGAIIKDDKGDDIEVSFSATEKVNLVAVNDEDLLEMILSSIEK
ncbi:bifunctional fructose-bisphosphatase/inositol-phosphate phosphatase [Pyrococcus sp. NA2]|uniref:bifunctional fructose-bisphosphatase/inositol-phosphate phosphatase n=1 Tax=Pyrococcus sp. (strain NA2) TaxID=342949 RepID=UPI00064FE97B|nr:bifunctional fructose-bisphosphatase/inositol-phosphate phosphatase [Pyrococcus sp. NA2]